MSAPQGLPTRGGGRSRSREGAEVRPAREPPRLRGGASGRQVTRGKNGFRGSPLRNEVRAGASRTPTNTLLKTTPSTSTPLKQDQNQPWRDPTIKGNTEYKENVHNLWQTLKKNREKERKDAIRDGFLADPDKPTSLAKAITPVGTCQDMCPEYERVERIVQLMVDGCEKIAIGPTGTKVPFESFMVKRFRRSAAGYDEQLPSDIRPPLVLQKTLNYLTEEVVAKKPLAKVHKFVWDRTRGIRNDFSIQQVSKTEDLKIAIDCFERIARFHILSLHQLSHPTRDNGEFDQHQEREQLNNTLLSLMYYYDDSRPKLTSQNEAEFRAYCIIFEIQDLRPDLEDRAQSWPKTLLKDLRIQTALKLYAAAGNASDDQGPLRPRTSFALAQANYGRFWSVVGSNAVSYLMACAAEIYFNLVRTMALESIWKAYKRGGNAKLEEWILDDLCRALGYDSEDQTQTFCEEHGFAIGEREDGNAFLDLSSVNGRWLTDSNTRRKQVFSKRLVETKRLGRTFPALINGLSVSQARAHGLVRELTDDERVFLNTKDESLFLSDRSDEEDSTMLDHSIEKPPKISLSTTAGATPNPFAVLSSTTTGSNPFQLAKSASITTTTKPASSSPFHKAGMPSTTTSLFPSSPFQPPVSTTPKPLTETPPKFDFLAQTPKAASSSSVFAVSKPASSPPIFTFTSATPASPFGGSTSVNKPGASVLTQTLDSSKSKPMFNFTQPNSKAPSQPHQQQQLPASTFQQKPKTVESVPSSFPFAVPAKFDFTTTASSTPGTDITTKTSESILPSFKFSAPTKFDSTTTPLSSQTTDITTTTSESILPSFKFAAPTKFDFTLAPSSTPTTAIKPTPQSVSFPITRTDSPAVTSQPLSKPAFPPFPSFPTTTRSTPFAASKISSLPEQPITSTFQFPAPTSSQASNPNSFHSSFAPPTQTPAGLETPCAVQATLVSTTPSTSLLPLPLPLFNDLLSPSHQIPKGPRKYDRRSEILDHLAHETVCEEDGILDQFFSGIIGAIVTKAVKKVESERLRARVAKARTILLSVKFFRKWKQNAWNRGLVRRAKERRRNFASTMQSLASSARNSQSTSLFSSSSNQARLPPMSFDASMPPPAKPVTTKSSRQSLPSDFRNTASEQAGHINGNAHHNESSSKEPVNGRPMKAGHKRSQTLGDTSKMSQSRVSKPSHSTTSRTSHTHKPSLLSEAVLKKARRMIGVGRTDTTRTDYFRLKALGIDPNASPNPKPPASKKRRISPPTITDPTKSVRLSPATVSLLQSRHSNPPPDKVSITPSATTEDDELATQVARIHATMAESIDWFRSEREKLALPSAKGSGNGSGSGSGSGSRSRSGSRKPETEKERRLREFAFSPSRTEIRRRKEGTLDLWARPHEEPGRDSVVNGVVEKKIDHQVDGDAAESYGYGYGYGGTQTMTNGNGNGNGNGSGNGDVRSRTRLQPQTRLQPEPEPEPRARGFKALHQAASMPFVGFETQTATANPTLSGVSNGGCVEDAIEL